jgi:hypothetical protein
MKVIHKVIHIYSQLIHRVVNFVKDRGNDFTSWLWINKFLIISDIFSIS